MTSFDFISILGRFAISLASSASQKYSSNFTVLRSNIIDGSYVLTMAPQRSLSRNNKARDKEANDII